MKGFENFTNGFAGAENHNLTLKFEINLKAFRQIFEKENKVKFQGG